MDRAASVTLYRQALAAGESEAALALQRIEAELKNPEHAL
jgi:hypothetical protein